VLARLPRPDGVVLGWRATSTTQGSGRSPEARAAGRQLLAEALGLLGAAGTRIRQHCPVCDADDHGPLASDGHVLSVSYAPGLVVAAAAEATVVRSLGVDVERNAGALPSLTALFAPAPPPDAAGWTAIEAALKADGRGLRVDPASVVVEAGWVRVSGRDRPFEVTAVSAPAGYVISLAIDPAGTPGRGAGSVR
jgi:4'-phosphopantetheinyl transferase